MSGLDTTSTGFGAQCPACAEFGVILPCIDVDDPLGERHTGYVGSMRCNDLLRAAGAAQKSAPSLYT